MKRLIRNNIVLPSLNHRDVKAYLLGQGWLEVDHIGDRATVLTVTDEDGETWEALVPARPTVGDYSARMADVVTTIARVEKRSEIAILNDLSISGTDVIRIRAPQASQEGSIAVKQGVALFEEARALLLSAACSAWEPRPTYHAGKVSEAVSYLDTVRLGQTERGSYVLTLLSPVDPYLNMNAPKFAPEFEDDPFSRRVTRRLADAILRLNKAITASDGAEGFSAFEKSVSHGISANLCEAAAGLIENGGGADISLTWARTRPAPMPGPKVTFTPDAAGVLREAAREFRRREPKVAISVCGWVVKLAREPEQFDGEATLRVQIEGETRPRNLRVKFDSADYQTVVDAHREQQLIALEGDLVPVGQRDELRQPRMVRAVPPSEDEN